MKLLKKLKGIKRPATTNSSISEIGRRMELLQRKVADFLNSKARLWSLKQLKILLACFCLVTGGASVYTAIHAVFRANGPPAMKVTHLPLEQVPHDTHHGTLPPPGLINKFNNHPKTSYDTTNK